jgi:hypothetical protein
MAAGGGRVCLRVSKRDHVNVGIGYVLQHFRITSMVLPTICNGLVDYLRDRGVLEGNDTASLHPLSIPVGGPLDGRAAGEFCLRETLEGCRQVHRQASHYAMVSGELAADGS